MSLKIALTKSLKRVEWVEVEQLSKSKSKKDKKYTLKLVFFQN